MQSFQALYDVCDELLEYVNALDVVQVEASKEVEDLSSSSKENDDGK